MSIIQQYLLPPHVEVVHYDQANQIFEIKKESDLETYKQIFHWVDKNYICRLRNYLQQMTSWGRKSYILVFDSTKRVVIGDINIAEDPTPPINPAF